ncbi:hypothetical protein FACS18945_5190 [Bacteroidia bacterium]|nr:hypothetical protein FACS18945_5190 [Bacteroidia bacterium]
MDILTLEKQIKDLDRQRAKLCAELHALREAAKVAAPESPDAKIALFRNLFRGREDVYANYWENATKGTSGFSPAKDFYGNYGSITDQIIKGHLQGANITAIYPMLRNEKTWVLAIDFDTESGANAYRVCAREFDIDVAVEATSSDAARAWIFFDTTTDSEIARKIGTVLLGMAMRTCGDISFSTYDKMYPNQDRMPKGGLGNFIPLPLQKAARADGFTVFLDDDLKPYEDQWGYLANIRKLKAQDTAGFLSKHAPLPTESESEPWLIPQTDDFSSVALPKEI